MPNEITEITEIQAKQRLAASEEPKKLTLTIECTGDAYKTLVNFLGVVQFNCNVGHSAMVSAYFDGDGADKIKIEGLPEGDYEDMARAICDHGGDTHMAQVGPSSALAWGERYHEDGSKIVNSERVYGE